MNKKTVTESGILELYLLGDLSADQKAFVEKLRQNEVDVRNELLEIEKAFQYYAILNAMKAPQGLKKKILN